ncbi:MAG: VanZ family protein [Bacteroidetes bacterium]|nr:VanZ family protein [Bacteroidota bacterium]
MMIRTLGNKKLFRVIFWGWLVMIITVSLMPGLPTPSLDKEGLNLRLDHPFHFLVFFFLPVFFFLWRSDGLFRVEARVFYWAILAGMLFAFLDEYPQKFIPGRAFKLKDIFYNCLGIITGIIFSYFYLLKVLHKKKLTTEIPEHGKKS